MARAVGGGEEVDREDVGGDADSKDSKDSKTAVLVFA